MRTAVATVAVLTATALLGPVLAEPAVAQAPTTQKAQTPQKAQTTQKAQCRRTLPAYPELAPGDSGKAVRTLQCVLNDAGLGLVTVDGLYGPETKAAVKKLVDGFEGPVPTPFVVKSWYWTILFARSRQLRGLEEGDQGIRVKTLQRALRADGESLVVDGDFGQQTKAAVRQFQDKCDLKKTGRVTDTTAFFLGMGGCNG